MIHLSLQKEIVLLNSIAPLRVEGQYVMFGAKRWGLFKKELPPGSWSQPIKCSDVTEEVAKGIAQYYIAVSDEGHYAEDWYKDYMDVQQIIGKEYSLNTALESFQSLLSHHGLKPGKTVLLIKEK